MIIRHFSKKLLKYLWIVFRKRVVPKACLDVDGFGGLGAKVVEGASDFDTPGRGVQTRALL